MDAQYLTDEELYDKYGDRLVRFAATIVGPSLAEDVVVDGVMSALQSRRWGTVDDRVGYLYRCVLSAGRMELRSAARRRRREDRVFRRRTSTNDDFAGDFLVTPEVRSAIGALSPRQRAVVFLTYWEDLDERAVARRLDISVGSVRQHLHRAKQRIGRQLDDAV